MNVLGDPSRPERFRERKAVRVALALVAALMTWSVVAAPSSSGDETQTAEPEELSGYSTFGDAMPVQMYFDHQTRLIPLGPAIAHSQTEVSMPSASSSIAWLVDNGIANGLHGTTTGAKVPTEAAAQQPGGSDKEEFSAAGGPIGSDGFIRVQAARALAEATSGSSPRAYGNAFIGNVSVLPAAGSPKDPPGTFDPGATYPGGEPGQTDPAPRGQMALVSIGKIASTSDSFREGNVVTSIAVATLKDINIGNRTSDNRCTNCIRIDWLRVEAFAQASGQEGGSSARYRVTAGRACRRGFNAETGTEEDRCLPLDPRDPRGAKGLQSIDELEEFNKQFERPIWTTISDGQIDYTLGVRLHLGSTHRSDSRSRRTTSPKDDPERNKAYPDTRPKDPERPGGDHVAPDKDAGQVAKAVAEGLDVELWTITTSQAINDGERRIAGTPAATILSSVDQDKESPGIQLSAPGAAGSATGTQTIPVDTIGSVRRVHLTLGVARAAATARPSGGIAAGTTAPGIGAPEGADVGGVSFGSSDAPALPEGAAPAPESGGPTTTLGIGNGPLALRIDWASVRVKPWPPGDMAKAISLLAIASGLWLLARRRLTGA
ncbi:MAG TPA: hypothetical protein VM600_01920 [Actinomycetota bacterium]|nr:hypothetical protein [Actinomycetota bacterium]